MNIEENSVQTRRRQQPNTGKRYTSPYVGGRGGQEPQTRRSHYSGGKDSRHCISVSLYEDISGFTDDRWTVVLYRQLGSRPRGKGKVCLRNRGTKNFTVKDKFFVNNSQKVQGSGKRDGKVRKMEHGFVISVFRSSWA